MTDDDFEQLPAENIDWEQLGIDNRELLRDWSRRKEQELVDLSQQCQLASSVCPVGRDRFFRCYWIFHSVHGLFVEENTVEFPAPEPSRHLNGLDDNHSTPPTSNSTDGEVSVDSRPRWSVYGSAAEVDRLLASLNGRGLREGPLRLALVEQRDWLKEWVGQCDVASLSTPSNVTEKDSSSPEVVDTLVGEVRDMILDLEERVYSGSLGSLKVRHYSSPLLQCFFLSTKTKTKTSSTKIN